MRDFLLEGIEEGRGHIQSIGRWLLVTKLVEFGGLGIGNASKFEPSPFEWISSGNVELQAHPENPWKGIIGSSLASLFLLVARLWMRGTLFSGRISGWGIVPFALCFLVYSSHPR